MWKTASSPEEDARRLAERDRDRDRDMDRDRDIDRDGDIERERDGERQRWEEDTLKGGHMSRCSCIW